MDPCGNHTACVGLAIDERLRDARFGDPYELIQVERLIREAILAASSVTTSREAPLSAAIRPNDTVLIKPNWVLHYNQSGQGMDCLVTHPTFILATLKQVLLCRPRRVIIGDAPIQMCDWDALVTANFRDEAARLASQAKVQLDLIDFRRTVALEGDLGAGVRTHLRDDRYYAQFDLGSSSMLEPISTAEPKFRVTNYDPSKLAQTHQPGRHQYLLCGEAFEVDVILSLPKLKTHRKCGVTGALKNLVGMNGNKDYLPHHRVGGVEEGGDCYPGRSLRKRLAEWCLDVANGQIGTGGHEFWQRLAVMDWSAIAKPQEGGLEGGWFGNDTAWRMVLDLNRILLYGRRDGTMAETPQRRVLSLTDAIVCGQGEGPLASHPIVVGAVTFSRCSPIADALHAALLRLDYGAIPLVRESFGSFRWPLVSEGVEARAHVNGERLTPDEVAERFGVAAKPAVGWAEHIEWRSVS